MTPPHEIIIAVVNLSRQFRLWPAPSARLHGMALSGLASVPGLPVGWKKFLRRKAAELPRVVQALRDVSFEVARGESVGIIGRNGSGKSTLLQIIAGTLQPTSGRAEVRGRAVALLELGTGFNPEFTGRENVEVNATLHGLTPGQIKARFGSILAFADIGDFIDHPVKTYSSGMALRLAFAVVAHLDAEILIIDEALAVGDVFFVQKCMAFLRRFQERGGVLLFVSHDAAAVTALCQKAVWLDDGEARMVGSPKEVTEAYLEASFGPAPPLQAAAAPAAELRADGGSLFDPAAGSFGRGGGQIVDVALEDERRRPLAWIAGGEIVTLRIRFQTREDFAHPIVGFYVKNHLGQQLFGDNTFFSTRERNLRADAGARFEAHFTFQMPFLPPGDYTVAVALADGTQNDHRMHHWVHDALAFQSVASPLRPAGLIGLPMIDVAIEQRSAARAPELAAAGGCAA